MADMPVWLAPILLAASFAVLAKGAGWLVDGAVGIAERLRVPKLLVGIVLVGLATTAPELAVSVLSALSGNPEMALGNAVGSVIFDDGVALALVGMLAGGGAVLARRTLVTAAVFIIVLDVLAFVLVRDGTLSRGEGGVLVAIFILYLGYVIWDRNRNPEAEEDTPGDLAKAEERIAGRGMAALVGLFLLGLVLVVGASKVVVESAVVLATALHVPKAVIALTVVALGTSIPEIVTCITAARKGHASLAVGDILGADILNISWVAGASAIANPLTIRKDVIYFMFPSMLAIVGVTLVGLIWKGRMTKALGGVLLGMYAVYMGLMLWLFPPLAS